MGEALRLVAAAVQLLTRLPVPVGRVDPDDLRRASAAFPLVGIAVAALGVGVRAVCAPLWGPAVATVAATAAMVAVTGALHEDGLADTADGVWGGADRAQRLAIMRDSRVGTYGMLAVAGALGLRVALLAPLELAAFARAVICGQVLGRAAVLLLGRWLPAASEGLGAHVVGRPSPLGALLAAATTALAVLAAAGRWAPVPLLAAVVATAACARVLRRRLGGVTGDAFGAVVVVVELAALAAVTALVRRGLL